MKYLLTLLALTFTSSALASDQWITCQYPAGRVPDNTVGFLYARPLKNGKYAFIYAVQQNSIFSRPRAWGKPMMGTASINEKVITLNNSEFSLETHYSYDRGGFFHGTATVEGEQSALMCSLTSDDFIHSYHLKYEDAGTIQAIKSLIQFKSGL